MQRSLFYAWASFAVANARYSDEVLDNFRTSLYLGSIDLLTRRRDHFQDVANNAQTRGDDKHYRVYTGLAWLYAIEIDERVCRETINH